VNRLKELVPSVQLYSSNARNTSLNIRGLGSTFGLTNDGIEPGVGFYIDGVYHARPAATALDFVDIDQIEILRGPQGTLFGKNTTAGAFNIITRRPSTSPSGKAEISFGNYNFIQAKASFTGRVAKNLSTRVSFSGTDRQGTVFHEKQQQYYNGQNNIGIKTQLLYTPNHKLDILLSGDYNIQRPDGSSLVVAGITPTLRSAYRQYDRIISDLGYERPTIDPFSRKIESDAPWKHHQEIGGAHLNIDYKIGKAKLTSTSAWRFWNWDPVNDRDFTAIPALSRSQAPSRHDQYSQEIRVAGDISKKISGVGGVFYLDQTLKTPVSQQEEVGAAQWRFVQTSATGQQALYSTPGLLDNYGIKTDFNFRSRSAAVFGQLDWAILKGLHIQPGLRFNYDTKDLDYARTTYGGLETTDPALLALKRVVYSNQTFNTKTFNRNISGNITVSYRPTENLNTYATYSTAYKSIGLNLGGLPTLPNGEADLSLAEIKPEYVQHYEIGIKTKPIKNGMLNISVFNTDIKDYQTIVQSPQLGVNRGYLSNAEKVNVKGLELDASYKINKILSINSSVAYTDGKYVSFTNAPLPLEETGKVIINENGTSVQQAFTDASGGRLPGISKWNWTGGFDLSTKGNLLGKTGRYFIAVDASYRSDYSSNPTPSKVLNISAYGLLNARLGFRSEAISVFIWSRNLGGTNYFEQLQAAAGNSGSYAGVLGDPRTFGITLRYNY
jgi:iron complex outermembrane receptor protein